MLIVRVLLALLLAYILAVYGAPVLLEWSNPVEHQGIIMDLHD